MGKEWDRLIADQPNAAAWSGRRGTKRMEKGDEETGPTNPWGKESTGYRGGERHGSKRCRTCGRRQFSGTPCRCPEPDWETVYPQGAPSGAIAMGRWHQQWAEAAYRVAKPSAYLLAFGGTRTFHRLACALEDAGWIIRDTLVWGYASGFPKSKASLKPAWEPIVMARKPGPLRDLAIDACRIPTSPEDAAAQLRANTPGAGRYVDTDSTIYGGGGGLPSAHRDHDPTAGRWPANIVLTDPIFDGGWEGVVGGGETPTLGQYRDVDRMSGRDSIFLGHQERVVAEKARYSGDSGTYSRFFILPKADRQDREPILDEYAYRLHRERGECGKLSAWAGADLSRSERTDSTSPERAISAVILPATPTDSSSGTSSRGKPRTDPSPTDTRSTTSTATSKTTGSTTSSSSILSPTSGSTPGASSETASGGSPAPFAESSSGLGLTTGTSPERAGRSTDGAVPATSGSSSSRNVCGRCGKPLPRVGSHPTVKPTDLMRHLVRLVTPAGGVVLDPFLGSGTTAIAAEMEGFAWIGIEREAEYVAIAEARLNGVQKGLGLDVGAPIPETPKTHPDLSKHQPKQRAPSDNYSGRWAGTKEGTASLFLPESEHQTVHHDDEVA